LTGRGAVARDTTGTDAMKIFSSLHLLAALGVLGAAGAASAQVDTSQWKCSSCPYPKGTSGSVDAGVGYVSDKSQKFGDYTGLDNKGAYLDLGGSVSRRGDDGYFADLWGRDLGLDSRQLYGESGREGRYTLRVGYAELVRNLSEGASTPFLGSGGTLLTLPAIPGFPAADTTGMPLAATLQPIDIGFKYKRLDLGGTVVGGRDWSVGVSYRHDERNGTRPTAGSFFSTASQFAAPVDEKTDQGEIGLAYATRKWQATLSYHVSSFRNDNTGVTWSNPFFPAVAGATTGQLALAPDNLFQQLRATGGYDITPTIRLTGDFAFGRLTQDDAFLPATENAALAPTVLPLPSASLGGRVDTYNGGLKLTATPIAGLRLIGSWDYDKRDNRTPVRAYPIVVTDMIATGATRDNTPFSYTLNRFKALGDYSSASLPWAMRITGGLELDNRDRTYQEVVTTREWTIWAKAAAQPTEKLTSSLKLAHSWRDNSTYGTATWFYVENPLLRKYNLADRNRNSAEAHLDFAISEKVSLGLSADVADDDYDHSPVGLTSARSANLALELSAAISEQVHARGFVQTQRIRSHQNGSQSFVAPDWTGNVKDKFDTLGAGVKFAAIPKKLDVGADVTFSRSRSDVAVQTAVGEPPFPTAKTTLDSLTVYGNYRLKDNLSIVGGLTFEHYDSDDWRLDGIAPGTLPNLLALGMQSPHYSVTVLRVGLRYRF
jgi:MtrB/PioB family decaheme-associated outer membrane protein